MIKTETELRAKMLYYLGRAQATLRRRGLFKQTAILYAESGITQWDMNIGDGRIMNRAQQRAKLENIVFCERPYCMFYVADAWISRVPKGQPRRYAAPSQDPEREEVLVCSGNLRHPPLKLLAFVFYERDAKGRPVFTDPQWASDSDPETLLMTARWLDDIWSVLK